ncbi:MAG: hypothetical protein ACTS68_01085, partial [Candidatus Hodgkinia cicadicola]
SLDFVLSEGRRKSSTAKPNSVSFSSQRNNITINRNSLRFPHYHERPLSLHCVLPPSIGFPRKRPHDVRV